MTCAALAPPCALHRPCCVAAYIGVCSCVLKSTDPLYMYRGIGAAASRYVLYAITYDVIMCTMLSSTGRCTARGDLFLLLVHCSITCVREWRHAFVGCLACMPCLCERQRKPVHRHHRLHCGQKFPKSAMQCTYMSSCRQNLSCVQGCCMVLIATP
jgi:hypothetical protein